MNRTRLLSTLLPFALLAGCKDETPPASAAGTAASMQAAVEGAAQHAADTRAVQAGDAPLKPGQSVQGIIEADVGKGTQGFRSLSTKVADDIAQQVDEKLDSAKGEGALDDANRKLEKLGTGVRVDADDVRDLVGGMAGKTFHDSALRKIDIIHVLQASLSGKAADGSKLELALDFGDKTNALAGSSLTYRPQAGAVFDFYETKDVQVTIDRFERNADGSYALAGSFTARDVPASPMAKKLDGKALASASGSFAFESLPVKEMPKFGP